MTNSTILVPDLIYPADTVIFDVPSFTDPVGDPVDNTNYAMNWYARTNTASEAATITGADEGKCDEGSTIRDILVVIRTPILLLGVVFCLLAANISYQK